MYDVSYINERPREGAMDNVNWQVFQAAATVTACQVTTSNTEATRSVFRSNYALLLEAAREIDGAAADAARLERKRNPPQSFVGTYP
jgi:hypothetical protein